MRGIRAIDDNLQVEQRFPNRSHTRDLDGTPGNGNIGITHWRNAACRGGSQIDAMSVDLLVLIQCKRNACAQRLAKSGVDPNISEFQCIDWHCGKTAGTANCNQRR